jgi:hypothetical protein
MIEKGKVPSEALVNSIALRYHARVEWLQCDQGAMFEPGWLRDGPADNGAARDLWPKHEENRETGGVYLLPERAKPPPEPGGDPPLTDLLRATEKILTEGGDTVRRALAMNILAFHHTVEGEKAIREHAKEIEERETRIRELERRLDVVEAVLNRIGPDTAVKDG